MPEYTTDEISLLDKVSQNLARKAQTKTTPSADDVNPSAGNADNVQQKSTPDIDIDQIVNKVSKKFKTPSVQPNPTTISYTGFDNSVGAWMDRLVRGQYASANLVRSMIKDYKSLTPDERLAKRKRYAIPLANNLEFIKDLYKHKDSVVSGLTGEEKGDFVDVLTDLGWNDSESVGINFIKEVAGLGLNIAADPLTYAAGPIFKTIGKGAKFAGKLPVIRESLDVISAGTLPARQGLKKLFSKSTGIPELDHLADKYINYRSYLNDEYLDLVKKESDLFKKAVVKANKDVKEEAKTLINIIENPERFQSDIPELNTIANNLRNHFSDLLTNEMKAGVPISKLAETEKGIQYFPRITSDEARKYLDASRSKSFAGNSKVWNKNIANAKQRITGDMTLLEFNDFVKNNGLSSLGGNKIEEFFMQNPFYATAIRGQRSAKAVSSAKFLDETGKIFGLQQKSAPSFYIEIGEAAQKSNPSLKGKFFDPIVAEEINNTYKKFFNPDEVNAVFKIYDNVHNMWKAWTTSIFPSFHVRNAMGNMWNNYLADVAPKQYANAMRLQMLQKGNKLAGAEKEIVESAKQAGVLGRGWFGADIPHLLSLETKSPKLFTLNQNNSLVRFGRQTGELIENNARLAHFLDKIEKGFTPEDAALSVKKYLFDYGDLAPFEKNVLKRLAPFYTWTRKNLPLQFSMALEKPEKFLAVEKTRRALGRGEEIDAEYLPEYMREAYPIKLGRVKNVNGKPIAVYARGQGLIPAADLLQVFRPNEVGVELMGPIPKSLIEFAVNKDFFREKDISRFKGDVDSFLGMVIPTGLKKLLTNFRLLNELDRAFFQNITDIDTGLTIGEKVFGIVGPAKLKKIDIEDAKEWYRFNIGKEMQTIKKAAFSAYRNGNKELGDSLISNSNRVIKTLNRFDTKYANTLETRSVRDKRDSILRDRRYAIANKIRADLNLPGA